MRSSRSVEDYFRDILEHCEAAESFLEGMTSPGELRADRRTMLAVVRALEVIGEAARQIPQTMRGKYPHVPWRGMTGMCDKVIHAYFGVDANVVWRTVREDLPLLREAVARILKEMEEVRSKA